MITLITGLPGNGKTLYALSWLKAMAEKEGRQVYYSGINDIKLPWIEHDATKWHELPPKSVIVMDEVQRVMRPRANGSQVPDFVAKLETHRHLGVDLVLITQHPTLLDANVRRLVGQHFHVVRKFGTQRAVIHEWASTKDNCDKSRSDSIRHDWKYPKEAFGYYKSAEAHTHKRRIPMKVYLLGGIVVGLPLMCWYTWHNYLDPHRASLVKPGPSTVPGQPGLMSSSSTAGGQKATPREYVESYQPRVAGLAYTAPVYDDVTKPIEAPYPAACVSMKGRCGCYSQQGTKVDTPQAMCEQIVAGGFFVAWKQPVAQAVARVAPSASQNDASSVQTVVAGIPYTRGPGNAAQSVLPPDPGHVVSDPPPPGRGRNLPPVVATR